MGVFMGALGAIASNTVLIMMLSGDFQKFVPFAGIGEEVVFAIFVIVIGMLSLMGSISLAIEIDRE